MMSCKSVGILAIFALLHGASSFSSVSVPKSLQSTATTININNGRLIRLNAEASSEVSASAPTLDGKRVLPLKVMKAGVKGHTVAAVYALLNSDYKRGKEGWENAEFVGVTMDLELSLTTHAESFDKAKMAHVRALSFATPDKPAMEDMAKLWRGLVTEAGGSVINAMDYLYEEDDDDDDDEDDWDPEMMAAASAAVNNASNDIVSPFDPASSADGAATTDDTGGELALNEANVDKILDEVRPYLIADGGNVAVKGVDAEKGQVFLELEGACGSCASSTVTMSMGIERVLKENFVTFKEVVQVEDPASAGPQELTLEAVQVEFNRLNQAILAMGGVARINGVDASTGVVDMTFRGSNKVRQGLELAILDIPFVNRVEFSMGEDE